MHPLLRLSLEIDRLNRRIYSATCWLTLAMVLIGAFNALARYGDRFLPMRMSSNGWIELQWYFFSLVFLAAAPYALRLESHVRVDVFYGRLSMRGKAWIDLLGGLLFLLPFCIFAFWLAWPSAMQSFDIRETSPDPGGLSRWPIKLAVPIAFVLLTLQAVAEVLRRALFLANKVSAEDAGLAPIKGAGEQGPPDPEADN